MAGGNLRYLRGASALVTGADHPTGLGAGRALVRAGATVVGTTRHPRAPACRSRAWDRLIVQGDRSSGSRLEGVLEAAQEAATHFLLPTQDLAVEELSARRAEFGSSYRFVLPPDHVVKTFLDKTLFYQWAKPRGFPLPESRIVACETELQGALSEMRYPVVLKPLYRTAEWNKLSPVEKAVRLESPEDVRDIPFDIFSVADSYIISEWIDGPDSSVHFCLAYCGSPGQMTASYTGRKLLQFPRQTGSTAICVGTENDELRELTGALFSESDFVGLGSLEVKYGPDGCPYITEPTVGRPNLQSYSAVAAGCNLQALAMADALSVSAPAPLPAAKNSLWLEESALSELATSRSQYPSGWREILKEGLRARHLSGAYWDWRDPAPFFTLIGRKMRALARRLRAVIKRR